MAFIGRITRLLLFTLVSVAITVVIVDLFLGASVRLDADGTRFFGNAPLRPYTLPVARVRLQLAPFLADASQASVVYDAVLGWSFRPNFQNDLMTINAQGIRADKEFALQPEGTFRIAVFGDSFTAGDDVSNAQTWAHHLEETLNQRLSYRVEVLNFGVSAYGADQAYLRWREYGQSFKPDMVIWGFQAENAQRNLNIFRPLYPYNTPPLSKPRFVLNDDASLSLINVPVLPPDTVADVLAQFPNHPLAPYEGFYSPEDFSPQWWNESIFATLLMDVIERKGIVGYSEANVFSKLSPQSEATQLMKAMVTQWSEELEAQGTAFVMVELVGYEFLLERRRTNQAMPYEFLLEEWRTRYTLLDGVTPLLTLDAPFNATGHYTPEGYRAVGQSVAEGLLPLLP